jgi:hypothetical protein
MEFKFTISINNINYNIEGLIHESKTSGMILTNWEPAFHNDMIHDFNIYNKKINWIFGNTKYPYEFIDYCNNIVDKFFKLKAFS